LEGGVVRRHRAGRVEELGDDVFEVLAAEIARDAGDPGVSWAGHLGYAARADLRVRRAEHVPDAVWMRVRDPLVLDHPEVSAPGDLPGHRGEPGPVSRPPSYDAAFDEVQRQLRL